MKRQLYPGWQALALTLLLGAGVEPCTAQSAFALLSRRTDYSKNEVQPRTISLKDALIAIKGHYGVDVVFGDQVVEPFRVKAEDLNYTQSVEKNLASVLRSSGLKYTRMRNGSYAIVNSRRDETRPVPQPTDNPPAKAEPGNSSRIEPIPDEASLPAAMVRTLTGEVKDEQGEVLPGVSIIVKGTTRGTVTDQNGKFSLDISNDSEVLIFSYVGYLSQEIGVGTNSVLDVTLRVDNKQLEEVVVVGYGTQKKANLTGAVSTIDFESEALNSRAVTNVSTMLAGMSSGIRVQQVNGLPSDNNNSSLNVRGVGSLNSSSAPLVVIDGQIADINSVSPNDVASVTILKDAASAAIYGSRASNGVILITTKTGKDSNGKVTFNYNNFIGSKKQTMKQDLVSNTADYMVLINRMNINSGLGEKYSQAVIDEWREGSKTDPIYYPNTNWWDAIVKDNTIMNHNVSARGGNERINFFSSVDYLNDDGLVPNTGYRRMNFRNNISYKINNWLRLGNSFTLISSKAEPANISDAFLWFRATTPAVVPRHPDGRYGSGQLPGGLGGTNNLLANVETQRGEAKVNQLQGKVFGVLTPLKGLSITASYFTDLYQRNTWDGATPVNRYNFQTGLVGIDGTTGSNLSLSNGYRRIHRQIYDLYADYTLSLGNHNFQALAGFNQEAYENTGFSASRSELLSYDTPVLNAAASNPQNSGDGTNYRMRSLFGRLTYNFKGKYLLETNLRYDGSSRFAPDKRWGLFPSLSAGWVVSEEEFWTPLSSVVNSLKLRASIGQLGNNGIGNYEWQNFYQAANYILNGSTVPGLIYNAFGNPNITWESTQILNIGADIRVFNNLTLDINYYDKLTKNILSNIPIPMVNGGIGAPRVNAAEVKNSGFETEARYRLSLGKLSLNFAGNFAYNKNRILKYKGDLIEPRGTGQAWTEGQPIGIYWVREVDHIVQDKSEIEAMTGEGFTFHPQAPGEGDFLYKNNNGDKAINDDDRILKGNPIPLFTYGGNVGLEYRGVDFNIYFDGVGGWDRYLTGSLYSLNHLDGYQWPKEYLNGWTVENPSTTIPKAYTNNEKNNQISDYFLHSAAYLKIRSIQLGYTIPTQWTNAIKMDRIRAFANMENFFTFTKWPTMDPEVEASGSDQTYPLSRTFSMGLSVSF